jgi:hypothetical protein
VISPGDRAPRRGALAARTAANSQIKVSRHSLWRAVRWSDMNEIIGEPIRMDGELGLTNFPLDPR